ncbi:MAG: hypothetical protein MUC68_00360 [Burkholderiaceae bacterium]|jgi:hypothetical protein|nr:hypothetical protein [Burkholderiaceae bacterium]
MPIELPGRVRGVKDADILAEARKRYKAGRDFADENIRRYRDAMRFVAGEQWEPLLKQAREAQRRPCLTMDRLTTHINQVVNDQRQSKPAIKTHPVDDRADIETAKIINGVIRNIEHLSNAPMVYETASFTQVAGGMGAWRVLTQYVDEEAFEQDLCLKRILDPTTVTWDPDAREQDASDGRWAFIETTVSKDAFKDQYPDVDCDSWNGTDTHGWWTPDSVRCAEYYRVVMKPATLLLLADGSVMDALEFSKSERSPAEVVDQRETKKREVQWFKLGGNAVLDSRVWSGKWIPLVRVVGNELMVDGKLIYTGLTQRAMDAQRMVNYQTSVVVELLSLQKTAPYIGAKGQFKGVEKQWANANVTNVAYLEYEPVTIDGNLAPPPQRTSSPQVPTGNIQALQLAHSDLQWITGQHAANFGAASNETSGRAIVARQQEGDTATYHYLDNLSRSILHTGRILVDLIPKIYDTKRVLRILGEDDTADMAIQDPALPVAMAKVQKNDGSIQRIYNLNVGRYDVAVSVGPSFGTKRMESVEAMTQLLQGNPQLWQAIGDLYLRNQDWPGAQEMADRLKKMVPPELQATEDGAADPQAQAAEMQAAMQQAQQMIAEREAALQDAAQQMQALQGQIQQLQNDALRREADVQTKTEAERIKAEAAVAVAAIEAQRAEVAAGASKADGEIAEIRQLITHLAMQMRVPMPVSEDEGSEDEGPEPEEVLLTQVVQGQQQLAIGQQQTAEALAMLADAVQRPKAITIQRTADGFQAVSMPAGGANG